MRDVLPIAVLVLLVLGAGVVVTAAACLTIAGARQVRRRARRQSAEAPARPAHVPLQRRVVWLACHTLSCGHLRTPHYPAGPGYVMCDQCGAHRRDPS
ncbi:hypothetical protein [Streptomyces sp. NPDC093111]|uniref:hypothetical protein n=1 Tax=Streptomyces sp. NPDC093111 TaxID=3154978 RepID=UPI003447327D